VGGRGEERLMKIDRFEYKELRKTNESEYERPRLQGENTQIISKECMIFRIREYNTN